jgi:RNA polymerase sigma factor (sigma-70 family)
MHSSVDTSANGKAAAGRFNSTRWSAVVRAQDGNEVALQELCQIYWYPLYGFLRSQSYSSEDSEDLVQSFLLALIQSSKHKLAKVDRAKGKFRSFLLASLKNWCHDARDRKLAEKRGGKVNLVSIDEPWANDMYRDELVENLSPDRMYDRRWARAVLDQALKNLESEMERAGQASRYQALKIFLAAKTPGKSHAEVALELGTTEGTVRNAVQRLRLRYGELIRSEIAETLSNPTRAAIDQELAYLMEIIEE